MRRALGVLRGETAGRRRRESGSAATAPPPGLDDLPSLIQRAEQAGVRTELRTEPAAGLPAGTAPAVYRIVQEALTNIVKHANASRIEVSAEELGDEVRILVRDDGDGFDPAAKAGGRGLTGMRERIELFGGEIEVSSKPGEGTAISARVPLGQR
jgi:signal transduction histidine kinase